MADRKKIAKTATIILGLIIIFALLYITNPPDVQKILITYSLLLGVSFLVYKFSAFKDKLIPLNLKGITSFKPGTSGRAIGYGVISIAAFFFATRFVPGLSLGLPVVPAAISDTFRFFTIIFIAPIVEEIFFRGVVLGYLRNTKFGRKHVFFAITLGAIFFALAHIGAYISGIYAYPNLPAGLAAFGANIGSFIVAGLFGFLAAFFVLRPKMQNLIFAIIFHMGLNLIVLNPFVLVS